MAPYLFTQAAFSQTPIIQYGDGSSARDYTYIDDVIAAVSKVLSLDSDWDVLNIGNSSPITLMRLIKTVENITNKKLKIQVKKLNLEEAKITYANIDYTKNRLDWKPQMTFDEGMKKFINWYKSTRL
jgi:UDP-glucuronate 4-epimerase